ncbi:tripartite tricarboxylate transporter permease [Pelagibacterium lacus]|uniref:Transporter n=1 Tax=Pelagibacterium lacus TaxID=2282655 RepID=A0A369W3W6_9HYPH|nr:tripartite tricarboxylate transporter permease [Pelagibacterium lacus]RDE08697.1 transporter [Pelagibacterium lacus]
MFQSFLSQIIELATPLNLGVLVGSTFIGIVFGVLPGLTATLAVALLSTLTFGLNVELALMAIIAVYVGAIYAPSHSSILLGIPGSAAGAATAIDGYPLAKKGLGGQAIATSTIASVIGTIFGLLALVAVSPLLVSLALNVTSVEFFLIALFGVLICGSLTSPDLPIKGWIAGVIGLLIAAIGIEPILGYQRFTFGNPALAGGIEIVPVILGGFALPQIFRVLRNEHLKESVVTRIGNLMPNWRALWQAKFGVLRSGFLGVGIGAIPGVGEDIAAWASYDVARKFDRDPDSFGTGNINGVINPETANNAAIGGSIIPVLTLGVPGSPAAAVLLGALNIHGIRPGPMLPHEFPNFIPQVAAMLFWSSLSILVLGLAMARLSVQVLRLPSSVLMPIVAFLAVVGSYSLGLNMFNIYMMFLFGVGVYLMEELGYPVTPVVIGLILGSMADVSLRRGLLAANGSLEPFYTRPIALILIALIVISLSFQSKFIRKVLSGFAKDKAA